MISKHKDKIIILDEIGPMQLKSAKFKHAILDLVRTRNCTLFATINIEDDPTLNEIRHSINTEILEISKRNRDELLSTLKEELLASIKLYDILDQKTKKGDN